MSLLLVCDIQTKFEKAIYGYQSVVASTNKMIKLAKVLKLPVLVTEQNPKALGSTDPNIDLSDLGSLHLGTISKTLFSMVTPEVESVLKSNSHIKSVIIVGIESHVCVLQTSLDLLSKGYSVTVLADAVSSCNRGEVPLALERIRQSGGYISTTESISFILQRDSGTPDFKAFSNIIKAEKSTTQTALETLVAGPAKSNL